MTDEQVGLTARYNQLHDRDSTDARILELRALHEETDREVLVAYAEADPEAWLQVDVPPFCPTSGGAGRTTRRSPMR